MPTSLTSNKITFNTKSISETNGKLDILPVGFVYWQLPGKKAPGDMFAGTWTNISSQFAGLFFRAEGGNAAEFYTGTVNGSNVLPDANKQEDKIRPIRGEYNTYTYRTGGPKGPYRTRIDDDLSAAGGDASFCHWWFDANTDTGDYGNPMAGHADGPEIRPVNTTIRIWERTA